MKKLILLLLLVLGFGLSPDAHAVQSVVVNDSKEISKVAEPSLFAIIAIKVLKKFPKKKKRKRKKRKRDILKTLMWAWILTAAGAALSFVLVYVTAFAELVIAALVFYALFIILALASQILFWIWFIRFIMEKS